MAKFGVNQRTERRLLEKMDALGIKEDDLTEKFIRGSGPGGQKINKSSSCVQLFHAPSGLEVKCQRTRSQALNRYWARRELCERLEQALLGEKSAREMEFARIRRQKRRRSRRQKEKILREKRIRSKTKELRKTPEIDD